MFLAKLIIKAFWQIWQTRQDEGVFETKCSMIKGIFQGTGKFANAKCFSKSIICFSILSFSASCLNNCIAGKRLF